MRARWTLVIGMVFVPALGCAQRPETSPAPGGASSTAGSFPGPGTGTTATGGSADNDGVPLGAKLTDTIPDTDWTWADWQILNQKAKWAVDQGIDRLPIGEAIARLGQSFVGATYTPGTLEAPGPEHLVINLREFDCVTFIENMMALTYFIRNERAWLMQQEPELARARYELYLRTIRYRGGKLNGYPSRLHYFSEWLSDGEAKGILKVRTRELGGVQDKEPIVFMSTHRASYKQLADDAFFQQIKDIEDRLNRVSRYYIPEGMIANVADGIKNGDVIAVTSTVAGLDIVHTGIALWKGDKLHLMHAPLVGKNVEISEIPLADRILGFATQDGIMVATPQEWNQP